MKLCPQCDFIYEDDQSVCDMDGKELVFEPTLTAFPGNPLGKQSVPRTRAQTPWFPGFPRFRRLAVTAMTGLMLGATLVLFYYLFTEGVSSAKPAVAPTSTSNPILPVPKKSGSPAALAAPGSGSTTLAEETGNADFQSATAGSSSNAVPQALLQAAAPANSTAALAGSQATDTLPAAAKTAPSLSVSSLPQVQPLPRLKPLPKLAEQNTAKRTAMARSRQASASAKKNESRFGSFLKKAGRVITKPFKK